MRLGTDVVGRFLKNLVLGKTVAINTPLGAGYEFKQHSGNFPFPRAECSALPIALKQLAGKF